MLNHFQFVKLTTLKTVKVILHWDDVSLAYYRYYAKTQEKFQGTLSVQSLFERDFTSSFFYNAINSA